MRLYSFVNYYLSPLQHGLQTAHCVSDMAAMVAGKVQATDNPLYRTFFDWAENHKTIIICSGGNVAMLEDLFTKLIDPALEFKLPLVKFYEDEQSLNNALTSVALIVPEKFYDAKFVPDPTSPHELSGVYQYTDADGRITRYSVDTSEFQFIQLLKSFRLA
jgi:hypothetical protein